MTQINHLQAAKNVLKTVHHRQKYINTAEIISANPGLKKLKVFSYDDELIKMYFNKLRGGVKEDWSKAIKQGRISEKVVNEVFGF
jgi:hypothetical protein